MPNILLGNILSAFAAGFLIASSLVKAPRFIYLCQCLESLFLLFAQIAFFQLSAAICLLLSILKNLMLIFGKYGKYSMVALAGATALFGVLYNTGGNIGLLPVAASLFFCIGSYFAKKCIGIKSVVSINLFCWCIYSFLICDYVSLVINLVSLILNVLFVIRYCRKEI